MSSQPNIINFSLVFTFVFVKRHFMTNFFFFLQKTTAHRRYEDDVPQEVKMRRFQEVGAEFRRISKKLNESQINQVQVILIEGVSIIIIIIIS